MYANFAALSAAGVTGKDIVLAPLVLLWKSGRGGVAVAFLVPAFFIEVVAAAAQRRVNLVHYAAVTCAALTLLIYTDRGADSNHLLDFMVLATVLGGCLAGAPAALPRGSESVRLAFGAVLLWVVFAGWVSTLVLPVASAVRSLREGGVDPHFTPVPLTDVIPRDAPILAEDAWVELSRGRLPTVMDPYAVARLSVARPELTASLVGRVEAREFAYLVLLQRLDASGPTDRDRWEDRAFGPSVVAAMRQNYRLYAEREGYVVYVPTAPGQ
jgi:hypothetical protein